MNQTTHTALSQENLTISAHRQLSEVSVKFLEFVDANPDCLRRGAFRLPFDSPFPDAKLQPWPTFASPELTADLARMAEGIEALIKSIPRRLFNNDPERISGFYGIDETHAALLVETPELFEDAISRTDSILTSNGLRCLELNCGSHLDAWFRSSIAGIQLKDPWIERFLASQKVKVRANQTGELAYAHFIRALSRSTGCDIKNVRFAVVMPPESTGLWGHISAERNRAEFLRALASFKQIEGGDCITCSYLGLECRGGRILANGVPVEGVYELTPFPPAIFSQVCRASLGGQVTFLSGLVTAVFSNKSNLALLSSPLHRDRFTAEERKFIDTYVPWTRVIQGKTVDFEGDEVSMPDLLLRHRPDFVIKRLGSTKKDDIFVGRFTEPETWQRWVQSAVEKGGWIAQLYVPSLPLMYQNGDFGSAPHDVIWGTFCFGGQHAGTWLRMDTPGKRGVINAVFGAQEAYLHELEE